MFKRVTAKLGNMRKPQEFVVQLSNKGNFYIQSSKSIGRFDMNTGRGVLNTKGCYFHHLSRALGAVEYQFPEELVNECYQAFILKGDVIGGVVIYAGITEIG